ncbi:lysozyme inhibitor LprI family protein [Arsenicitalea aurantiaca]|nr:lysozyme inhibitor LprI family protein [Arsenicitalea aurantiaca]
MTAHRFALPSLCVLAVLLASPAVGQESDYTEEDAMALQSCIEAARDLASDEPDVTPDRCIGIASAACQEAPGGSSTVAIATCNARETAWWDELLNAHYQSLEETLEPDLAETLREAERAWIAFRDADCGFAYEFWAEGTIRTVVATSCQLQHTARRALTLGTYLDTGY